MNSSAEARLTRATTVGVALLSVIILAAALSTSGCGGSGGDGSGHAQALSLFPTPTRSSTIALTANDKKLVVVNRQANSVSVLRVRAANGTDSFEKLAEIAVGQEPRYVCLSPDDSRAFVTNAVSGTVSVVSLVSNSVIKTIPVGNEPRGIACTPHGTRAFVANHTEGTVSVLDTATLSVIGTVAVGGNPTAIAVSNDGDASDLDESVFVTQFFAEPIPGGPGEGFDNGRQGVVWSFPAALNAAATPITLAPLSDSGFTADRKPLCLAFNANVHSQIFCPNQNTTDPNDPSVSADPQGVFPNQLQSLVLRQNLLYAPNIGASPEPPVQFRVNVQALVNVIDTTALLERTDLAVNLNAQIKLEVQPANPTQSTARIFGNDLVAIDADRTGSTFLIVSRGGNYVLRAGLDANGALTIGAPSNVVRYQTGNLPSGVAISSDGRRAYANNDANLSVTAIDLENDVVLQRDVPSGNPPAPGSFEHAMLVGKLAFTSALGVPDFGIFSTPIRDIVPLEHRGKASDNGWSSCASCHPDGLSDSVTWIFGTGPRQTLPLDAFFSKASPLDQRISNWSAVMGSITDFNNNARGVQGGIGFAGNPPPTQIFQHGITEGASASLDAMTLWVQTVRPLNQPDPTNFAALGNGANLFAASCASCHGGDKWSKSQTIYDNNPTFGSDPNAGGVAFDSGLTTAGPQIVQLSETNPVTQVQQTLRFLDGVGTFDPNNPLEIRGQPPTAGNVALGALGFQAPSLLDVHYHAPYFHDGSARTLDDVFARHGFGGGTIETSFSPQDRADLELFLDSIDGATLPTNSATDQFLRLIRG